MARGGWLAQVLWLDTVIATGLVLGLGNIPDVLELKGLWAPALLGPLGLALLLAGTDQLAGTRLERVSALAFVGVLYGLVSAAPIVLAVSWLPKLLADIELPYLVSVNAGGIGPLIPPLVRRFRRGS